MGATAVHFK